MFQLIDHERQPSMAGKANPFQADERGYAFFHATGGAYRVRAFLDSFEHTDRYVAVGLGAENDVGFATPRGAWDAETEYAEGDYVSHSDEGPLYLFISRIEDNVGNEPDVATPGDTAEWMFAGAAVTGPSGAGDRLDIPIFVQGRPRAGELFPRIDMAADALIVEGLGRATARVAPNQKRVFTVRVNGDPIMTITFPSGQTFGVYSAVGSLALAATDILTVTGNSTVRAIKNGAIRTSDAANTFTGHASGNIAILGHPSGSEFSTKQLAFFCAGASLSDAKHETLYEIVNQALDRLGVLD